MARKRSKKAKARNRRRRRPAKGRAGGRVVEHADPNGAGRADIGETAVITGPADEAIEDPVEIVELLDEDPVEIVELSDEELDDPVERERLIAAAAGLLADVGAPERRPKTEHGPPAVANPTVSPPPHADGGSVKAPGAGVPTMTPDALAALSEIHHEGLASLPPEFILDLGGETTDVQRERILAAAAAHADMQEAIYRVPTEDDRGPSWKAFLSASLLAVSLLVLARPPAFVLPPATAAIGPGERARGVHLALLLQAEQIEAFRSRENRLPNALDDLGRVVPGVRFVRSSNRLYQLVAVGPDGRTIIYDSAAPAPEFDEMDRPWAIGNDAS